MILARAVIQAKFGKANEVVAYFRAMAAEMPEEQFGALQPRILTDISGPFDTVVIETTHESLAAFEAFRTAMFAPSETAFDSSQLAELVVSGRNEYYTIETM